MSSMALLQSLKESILSQASAKAIYGEPVTARKDGHTGGKDNVWIAASRVICGLEFAGSSVLNKRGVVAGFADTSTSDPFPKFCFSDCFVSHAFEAGRGGVLTDLGALPGGGSSAPIWISANGLIAGISENGTTDPLYKGLPEMRAVLWQQGQIMDLGTLPEGGYQSEANAMNSSGQVVGAALNTENSPLHPKMRMCLQPA